ncbi:hypothetical protein [Desmospora profundinema]|uniref:Uncharacterized protein n=1 Tax=Desmospora profundinema TaxID=1571184 RepID=A0ABU1IJF1_9BACL|nr:hypothetical protein [Desmospora profundinema]MDR6224523.1 hypothetical protein [Desmospora profundinema]
MWVSGGVALVSACSLAVLVQTGWFHGLEEELGVSRRIAGLFLLLQGSVTYVLIPLGNRWELQVGTLMWMWIFSLLWRRLRDESMITLFTGWMVISSSLFLMQEWFWVEPLSRWGEVPGMWLAVTLPVAAMTTSHLVERLLMVGGGAMLSELFRLVIHRNELTPVVWGEAAWLDRFWLVTGGVLLFHYSFRWAAVRLGRLNPFG